MSRALVALYLAAIVAANLSIGQWGIQAAIYNAFVFIGLDLVTRDALHDLWRGRLLRNMSLLIAVGSLLSLVASYLFVDDPAVSSERVALASFVAFASAAAADTIAYHKLRNKTWYERANQSNAVSAAVDSLVFPLVLFGSITFAIVFALFCAKLAGGVVWSFVLARHADGRAWLGRNRELWATDRQIDRSFDAYR